MGINTVFQTGDTLFGKLRPNLRKVARADFSGYCSTEILVLRARTGVDAGYLSHVLRSESVLGFAAATAFGTKMPRTSWSLVGAQEVFTPRFETQRRISEILDAIDEKIKWSDLVVQKLCALREGIVSGELAGGAAETSLADASVKITDGTHQSVVLDDSGSIPFLYVSSIRDGRIHWSTTGRISDATYRRISPGREAVNGMVLYTAVGSFGHAAAVDVEYPFAFQRHIACIYPDFRIARGTYLSIYLNSEFGRKQSEVFAVGNAQKTVSLSSLSKFKIWLPTIPEQDLIVERIHALDQRIEHERAVMTKLESLRIGMTSDLIAGHIPLPIGASD
ncbi:restriction endonuclease subunit S [Cryobacterium breve]|uniref:Restriction endonuclease subunit S n=1 Tax=Cryobacterium breve TaxID=1259258 RepID=A0ABY7NCE8_9MICO|nr:restriction endonuclease subunit S [Cryobacterium breve]WBM80190.1 restriction endonuclease subunit S [Cryobacterium breve]